jgi:hypothetical protein
VVPPSISILRQPLLSKPIIAVSVSSFFMFYS